MPTKEICFTWKGAVYPAPRMVRSDKWRKPPRDCVAKYWSFRDQIRIAAGQAGIGPGMKITHLDAMIYLPIPASYSRKQAAKLLGQPHTKKPDLDNLCKSLLDALNPEGDQACWSIGLEKRYEDRPYGARLELTVTVEF